MAGPEPAANSMTSTIRITLAAARTTARMKASGRLSRRISSSSPDAGWRSDVGGQVRDDDVHFVHSEAGELPDPAADVVTDLRGDLLDGCGPADADLQAHVGLGAVHVHGGPRQPVQVGA